MMHYKVPIGNRFMDLSFEELYAIGNFWQRQCDREEIESAIECMRDCDDFPEIEDLDECIEFCAREYRRYLNSSTEDQYNFDRAQQLVREYLADYFREEGSAC